MAPAVSLVVKVLAPFADQFGDSSERVCCR